MKLETGQLSKTVQAYTSGPSAEYIPLGDLAQLRTTMASSQQDNQAFRIACINCDALGIVFDCPEHAPSSTPIKCQHCGAPRGTSGDLRRLSYSTTRNLFDF